MNKKVNELDYEDLDEREVSEVIYDDKVDENELEKVFFIYSDMDFTRWDDFIANNYQFFIFNRFQEIEDIFVMQEHLFVTVFQFWMPYFIAASVMYMVICAILIRYLAEDMTKPFIELSQRIRLNVKNIQKRKK